ncbi:hypothetical protein LOTGIDRAFT_128420 [Lottia gigantea]|uniref:UDP-glucose 4-epimerase n=1 Tax=Lottia gigantea TaxID=225164 RepID=V3ZQY3_LOTGI|nr:hypothetical protein LOTGIDRAFT_128420 [Lottia gigantea]ESO86767.1 hypothetical protein LOTGIDRAFT_128420 [Lottia gigantea]
MSGNLILVTGGAGYIGSHTVIELIEAGYDVVILDNLVNSSFESIKRVEEITNRKITTYNVDLLDVPAIEDVFQKHQFFGVIHFAGLKAVGESCRRPLSYYRVNVGGAMNLLNVMEKNGIRNLVFSSSATVYGTPKYLPLDEKHPTGGCTNPYGKTKFVIEEILSDICAADNNWNVVVLRYFNPVGSHVSGKIGEDPQGIPNNLMPFVSQVAVGKRPELSVYGDDYDTPDGTGVRDYIHVVDLSQGHVAAVKRMASKCGFKTYNLGTGVGCSVLDMVKAFEKASGKKVPYTIQPRRPGDVGSCYASTTLAAEDLGWKAQKDLNEMCVDLWRWQSMNPNGYRS